MVAPRSAHPTHAPAPTKIHKSITFMPCTPATGRSSGWRHEHGTTAWTRRELTCPLHRIAIRRPLVYIYFDLSCLRLSRLCQEYWNGTPGSCIPSLSLRAMFLTPSSPRHVIVSRPLRRPTTKLPHYSLPATIACHLQYAGLEASIATIPRPSLHPSICSHVALDLLTRRLVYIPSLFPCLIVPSLPPSAHPPFHLTLLDNISSEHLHQQ
jgi:hypothetical protein